MARRGGLLGDDSFGRRLLEAGAKRALGVDLAEDLDLRSRLVETSSEARLLDRAYRRLGWLALTEDRGAARGQDDEPADRLGIAKRVRELARRDSQMLYAIRLRNAFCFGQGVPAPRAPDPEVQVVIDEFWTADVNKAELTTAQAQWRAGKDLWENANVYFVAFADGADGKVLIGSLQHDQVKDVVRDPQNWARILYYVVTEFVYEWDYDKNRTKPNPKTRTVYYEALEGITALEADIAAGRTDIPQRPPAAVMRPGRVVHVAINRGKEQAFGEPEMRTNIRWAGAFNDILAGQVEKAKAAQSYLMKVKAKGARTQDQLRSVAMAAVGRRSPFAQAPADATGDVGWGAGQAPGRPGGQFWENDSLEATPFALDSGSGGARQDMESASQAFATGTNFPGHYFFGDPGSLAGSMAVELPVLKLTEVDQKFWEDAIRVLIDLKIRRAIEVGDLTERRELTDDEQEAEIEADGPDGKITRDLTYELKMPDALRRNVPELMQVVVDTVTSFDPNGSNFALKRALLGFVITDLFDFTDAPALLDKIMAEAEAEPPELPPGQDPATFTGADGDQHTSANPTGAPLNSRAVESAMRELYAQITQAVADPAAEYVAGGTE